MNYFLNITSQYPKIVSVIVMIFFCASLGAGIWVANYDSSMDQAPEQSLPSETISQTAESEITVSSFGQEEVVKVDKTACEMMQAVQDINIDDASIIRIYTSLILEDNDEMNPTQAANIAVQYLQAENEKGLAHGLLLAIAHQESCHKIDARSNCDARGLMQVLYSRAKEIAIKDGLWHDPKPPVIPAGTSTKKRREIEKAYQKRLAKSDKAFGEWMICPKNNVYLGVSDLTLKLRVCKGDLEHALDHYSGHATHYPQKIASFHQKVVSAFNEAAAELD